VEIISEREKFVDNIPELPVAPGHGVI
jgi:hypothetical protein